MLADKDMRGDVVPWHTRQQPTPEWCRLFHGIDCRCCVGGFSVLDRLVTLVAHSNADQWRRDFDERQRAVQAFDRKWEAIHARRG
jgi:hypothetical protein